LKQGESWPPRTAETAGGKLRLKPLATVGVHHLKSLSEMGRVQQLDEGLFATTQSSRLSFASGGDDRLGVAQKKAFLKFQVRFGKTTCPERGADPVPADVAGEVLFAGAGQQVV
jgi:hypothetical protein